MVGRGGDRRGAEERSREEREGGREGIHPFRMPKVE
jgi:hypothetical protein